MIQFMQTYWLSLLLILCFLAIMVILWKRGKKETVKAIIYMLVCQAEQQFGSKTGQIKWASVWGRLYKSLPWIIRILFTQQELEQFIEEAVDLLKRQLKNKEFNLLSYNQEVDNAIKDKISY